MAQEKTTQENIEIKTNYFNVSKVPTGETDWEKRYRIYGAKNVSAYAKRYPNAKIVYFKEQKETTLENLLEINLDFKEMNLAKMLEMSAKIQSAQENILVKNASILQIREIQTGGILMSEMTEIKLELF